MNIYDFGHHPLNPIGHYNPVCHSQGCDWKIHFLMDRQFRLCRRCEIHERKIDNGEWEVNIIKLHAV